jgi:hypothetical protein
MNRLEATMRPRTASYLVVFTVLAAASAGTAQSVPIYNPANGHSYDIVDVAGTWEQAHAAAGQTTYGGLNGHMVTIDSVEENLFVTGAFGAGHLQSHWMGGFQEPGATEPDGGWTWVTGETVLPINWAPAEPNNYFGSDPNEAFMAFDHGVDAEGKQWNDLPGSNVLSGFVVEFEGGTWADLGNGLAGVGGIPTLSGTGSLTASSVVTLTLENAKPFAPSWLIVGLAAINAPFKGGIIVPSVNLFFPLTTDFFGASSFGGLWPTSVPTGLVTYFQWWISDAAGPVGFASSNALAGTTP